MCVSCVRKMFPVCVILPSKCVSSFFLLKQEACELDHDKDNTKIDFFFSIIFSFVFIWKYSIIHNSLDIPSNWFNAVTLTSLALTAHLKMYFFLIFVRQQVPKDHESWEKYSVMRINMRPKRPAAFTCVNMLGVYLSATPHGSSRQAYLSGLACIINTRLIVSK